MHLWQWSEKITSQILAVILGLSSGAILGPIQKANISPQLSSKPRSIIGPILIANIGCQHCELGPIIGPIIFSYMGWRCCFKVKSRYGEFEPAVAERVGKTNCVYGRQTLQAWASIARKYWNFNWLWKTSSQPIKLNDKRNIYVFLRFPFSLICPLFPSLCTRLFVFKKTKTKTKDTDKRTKTKRQWQRKKDKYKKDSLFVFVFVFVFIFVKKKSAERLGQVCARLKIKVHRYSVPYY